MQGLLFLLADALVVYTRRAELYTDQVSEAVYEAPGGRPCTRQHQHCISTGLLGSKTCYKTKSSTGV